MLCSWARHFTLTVPLSAQVYKWVPANLMLVINPPCSELAYKPEGSKNTLSALCFRNLDMLWPGGPHGSYADLMYLPSALISFLRREAICLMDYASYRVTVPVDASCLKVGVVSSMLQHFYFDRKIRQPSIFSCQNCKGINLKIMLNYWRKDVNIFLVLKVTIATVKVE